MISLVLLIQGLISAPPDAGVEGTVRAAEDGRVMSGVLVEILDAKRWTTTDTLGRYRIDSLSPGDHRARFRAPGRVTLELSVKVSAAAAVHLDIELAAKAVEIPPLIAVARHQPDGGEERAGEPGLEPLSPAWALRAVPGLEDIQNALSFEPTAAFRGEDGGTLHLGGGASNQVLVTVDGFPIYGATHFGAAWSALNPDVVRNLAVRPAGATVQDQGYLSGTVAVRTSLLAGDQPLAQGAATPSDVRNLFRGDLGGGKGSFLVSGRRSIRNFFVEGAPLGERNGYDDWLATMAVRVGPGRLRALSFRSGNQLGFESRADTSATVGLSPSNNLEWGDHTDGLSWEAGDSAQRISMMAWRAGTHAAVEWRDANRPIGLASRFDDLGFRAQGTWAGPRLTTTVGVGVNHVETGYQARSTTSPSLVISSTPTLLSGFVEQQWRWGRLLSLEAGVRATSTTSGSSGLDPRLSIKVAPSDNLSLTMSAGRVHQFTQSLSNDETFLSNLLALELPVAVGTAGVPVARSDNLAAQLVVRPGAGLTLTFDGYTRRLANLILAAPSSDQPFATVAPGIGSGGAGGLIARVGYVRGRLELAGSAGLARASRTLGATTYTPGFQRQRFLRAALLVHADVMTSVALALTAGAGQQTTPVMGLDWRPNDPLGGDGELAGTPTNMPGPLNAYRLPGFQRLDFGLRRDWRFRNWSAGRQLTTSFRIENLLNHPNAIGLVGADGLIERELLRASGRSVRLELGWAF